MEYSFPNLAIAVLQAETTTAWLQVGSGIVTCSHATTKKACTNYAGIMPTNKDNLVPYQASTVELAGQFSMLQLPVYIRKVVPCPAVSVM